MSFRFRRTVSQLLVQRSTSLDSPCLPYVWFNFFGYVHLYLRSDPANTLGAFPLASTARLGGRTAPAAQLQASGRIGLHVVGLLQRGSGKHAGGLCDYEFVASLMWFTASAKRCVGLLNRLTASASEINILFIHAWASQHRVSVQRVATGRRLCVLAKPL